jgi:hypothetical protein
MRDKGERVIHLKKGMGKGPHHSGYIQRALYAGRAGYVEGVIDIAERMEVNGIIYGHRSEDKHQDRQQVL